ncbi:Rv2175c family DNA-binding protein [Marinactinospora thermotolerans]|uniref:Uncharacterized protein n=1 Tax=Marinactinospora thermotolerans DSM 45154 TaxID=1122192 RepID=A0A1T4MG32_9ACTN|nr:Rv2175c family DNA-binding protein [Marinactinospora thermotolerans]SJZ65825.1 hypothetical protein SAMN02745673_01104 [Marinactinospora thermotolerans DSM 45154]
MTQIDPETDALVGDWLTLREAAKALNVSPNRIKQLVREHRLAGAVRDGELSIPAAFVTDGEIVKGLPGTLTVLADCGFAPEESLRWMFTSDESLPGSPIDALRANRGTEVRRRAQAMLL